jgi:hypothetical protein
MSDGLFYALLACLVVSLLGFGGLGVFALQKVLSKAATLPVQTDPATQRQQYVLEKAKQSCASRACCKCKHWDIDAGRAAITQNPAFAIAAQTLSPNRMGRSAEDVTPLSLPIAVDTWELIGVCGLENVGRHAIDQCEQFTKVRT